MLRLALACVINASAQDKPVNILFLGNSYTYYNGMPAMFERMASEAGGPKVSVTAVTIPGAPLQVLYEQSPALATVRKGGWNYVVLQDQSTLGMAAMDGKPIINDPAAFQSWSRIWNREIQAVGAKTVFYSTWASRSAPEDQKRIDYSYMAIAKELRASVAPVGIVWHRLQLIHPDVPLYDPDGSHPSISGSYLAACVLMDTILHRPCTAPPKGVPSDFEGKMRPLISEASRQLSEAGGQLLLPRPPFASASLPQGLPKPTPVQINGTWRGDVSLYGSPATLEITFQADDKSCGVSFHIKAKDFQSNVENTRCTFSENSVRATVPHSIGLIELHEATVRGGELIGVMRQFSYSQYWRREGQYTLQRAK